MTNRRRLMIMLFSVASVVAIPRQTLGANEQTFHGEIADSPCAMNVHSLKKSHSEMMNMRHDLKTNADCARFCVKERGGKFVLQLGQKVYRLDNSDQAEPFAGQQVKIVGILDPTTNTITVNSITSSAPDPHNSSRHQ